MKQYRAPVTTLSKQKLEWVIKRRKEVKVQSPFGMAHFPAGTIAVFERPGAGYIGDKERSYPGQIYSTIEAEVLGVMSNGPTSWLVVLNQPDPLVEDSFDTINVQWARKIIKRGNGPLLYKQPKPADLFSNMRIKNKHPNHYYIGSVEEFVSKTIANKVGAGDSHTHLYSVAKLVEMMKPELLVQADRIETSYLYGIHISKKKFHRIFERHLPRAKVSRKKEAAEERKIEKEIMEREMELIAESYELDNPEDNQNISLEDSYFDYQHDDDLVAYTGYHNDDQPQVEPENKEKVKSIGDLLREVMENDPL